MNDRVRELKRVAVSQRLPPAQIWNKLKLRNYITEDTPMQLVTPSAVAMAEMAATTTLTISLKIFFLCSVMAVLLIQELLHHQTHFRRQ